MSYADFLGNQQALINANNRLSEYARERQNQRNALEEAENQFYSLPQGGVQKALATGAGAVAGAGIGGAIGARYGSGIPGAVVGGLGGVGLASLAAVPVINRNLDKKHPERVEARAHIDENERLLSTAQRNYDNYKPIYNRSLAHNAQLAHENPSYYQQAVDELGGDYPIGDVNASIRKLEREEALNALHEAKTESTSYESQVLQNQILKEELEKQKFKNAQRKNPIENIKEAFTQMKMDMEKIAAYYA